MGCCPGEGWWVWLCSGRGMAGIRGGHQQVMLEAVLSVTV